MRIAINGFGRIGRLVLRRVFLEDKFNDIEIVAINDITDAKTLAHLLKYDSVHKIFSLPVEVTGNNITINGKKITIYSERNPENLPWKELDIDYVVESTGLFRTYEKAFMHVKAGAKRVVLSAPAKGDKGADITIVLGVNEKNYDPQKDQIISNASCTTNCLAPITYVLNKEFGIEKGFMSTIHSYTNDQRILDLPHRDLRRARAAALSIIPTTTGAAKAIGVVIPELDGKLDGWSIRVPTPDVSLVDLQVNLRKETSVEEINAAMKKYAHGELKGILEYLTEPLVSVDLMGNSHSSIFDPALTKVNGNVVKVISWYDNEWGYSCRVVDLIKFIGDKE